MRSDNFIGYGSFFYRMAKIRNNKKKLQSVLMI
jgi:hypothetical protein